MKNKIAVSNKELFYNEFSDRWEFEINNSETQKRIDVVFNKLFKKKDLKNKKFLEIGCGLGFFSEIACKLGAKVTGIDIGNNLIKKTKKRVPGGKFLTSSAAELPFTNNCFDIVLSTEVIEHVANQDKALDEMFRVLRCNGLLVITTPNKIYKPLFDLLGLLNIRPYKGNESWYYPWELKRILLSKRYRMRKEVYFNFLYPTKPLNYLERFHFLKYLMINQGYLLIKRC